MVFTTAREPFRRSSRYDSVASGYDATPPEAALLNVRAMRDVDGALADRLHSAARDSSPTKASTAVDVVFTDGHILRLNDVGDATNLANILSSKSRQDMHVGEFVSVEAHGHGHVLINPSAVAYLRDVVDVYLSPQGRDPGVVASSS
jgi:hypothetical protein